MIDEIIPFDYIDVLNIALELMAEGAKTHNQEKFNVGLDILVSDVGYKGLMVFKQCEPVQYNRLVTAMREWAIK